MRINYKNAKLEKLCESEKKLAQTFGQQAADRIIECLQALDASTSLARVPKRLRPHPREPKNQEVFQIDILKHKHSTRLFFTPAGTYDILDYTTILEVEIIHIGKTHS
jgi:hypothetical protein